MSRRLLYIFFAITGLLAYFYFAENIQYLAIPMGISATALLFTWILQQPIDSWWARRSPYRLDREMRSLYERNAFFAELPEEEKIEFERRIGLYLVDKEFISMSQGDVGEDLKHVMAYYSIMLGWKQSEPLMKEYDRVVFYPHPFLTPHYGEQVHTYEVEHVDGTIILAADQFMAGFLQPGVYYQTGLHAAAEVFRALYMSEDDIKFEDDIWETLERISGVPKATVEQHTGMAQEDPWPVAIHHLYSYPSKFKSTAPGLHVDIQRILKNEAHTVEHQP